MVSEDEKEFQLIQESVENYFRGVIEGNYAKVVRTWHMEGKRIFIDSQTNTIIFQNSPANPEYATLRPSPQMKQFAVIEAIDFTGQAASVRLKWYLETPGGDGTCTDYLLLLKSRDSWTIVSKVSYKN
jgi:hypothetical protein